MKRQALQHCLAAALTRVLPRHIVHMPLKHEFDQIDTIDILDCNGGDHGYAFATNFNPEINLREVSAPGSYWENGHWVEIPADERSSGNITLIRSAIRICICCTTRRSSPLPRHIPESKAHPFLYDLWTELSGSHALSGGCGNAFYHPDQL